VSFSGFWVNKHYVIQWAHTVRLRNEYQRYISVGILKTIPLTWRRLVARNLFLKKKKSC